MHSLFQLPVVISRYSTFHLSKLFGHAPKTKPGNTFQSKNMNIKKEKSLKYEFDKQPIRAIAHPDITFFDSSFGRAGNLRIYGSLSSRRRKVCLFFHLYYFLLLCGLEVTTGCLGGSISMKPIKIRTKDLIFKNSTIFYRKRTLWNFEYLGSPTHPTSSGLLGSGSSINPEEICEEQHLHFEKGIFFFFSFYLSKENFFSCLT